MFSATNSLRSSTRAAGGVSPGSLIFDFSLASARIPQQLVGDDEAFDRLQRLVGNPEVAAGRVAKLPYASRAFDRDGRQPQALGLLALFLGGKLVMNGLPDFRIGLHRRLDGIPEFHAECRRGAQEHRPGNDNRPVLPLHVFPLLVMG